MIDAFYLDDIKPKKDSNVDSSTESEIFKNMVTKKFLDELTKSGIDMEDVSNGYRYKNEAFHKFNLFVDEMSNDHNISMVDIVMILEESFFDIKTVIKCFNEENLFNLRYETSKKYNVKIKKSKLESIIE